MVKADSCIPAGLVIVIADAKLQQLCNELGNGWYAIPAEQLAQTFGGVYWNREDVDTVRDEPGILLRAHVGGRSSERRPLGPAHS